MVRNILSSLIFLVIVAGTVLLIQTKSQKRNYIQDGSNHSHL